MEQSNNGVVYMRHSKYNYNFNLNRKVSKNEDKHQKTQITKQKFMTVVLTIEHLLNSIICITKSSEAFHSF